MVEVWIALLAFLAALLVLAPVPHLLNRVLKRMPNDPLGRKALGLASVGITVAGLLLAAARLELDRIETGIQSTRQVLHGEMLDLQHQLSQYRVECLLPVNQGLVTLDALAMTAKRLENYDSHALLADVSFDNKNPLFGTQLCDLIFFLDGNLYRLPYLSPLEESRSRAGDADPLTRPVMVWPPLNVPDMAEKGFRELKTENFETWSEALKAFEGAVQSSLPRDGEFGRWLLESIKQFDALRSAGQILLDRRYALSWLSWVSRWWFVALAVAAAGPTLKAGQDFLQAWRSAALQHDSR